MTKNRSDVVIVGGVACGPKAAATLARRRPDLKITLFEKGEEISYGTCGLPYFASGDIDSFRQLTVTSYDVPRDIEFFRRSKGFDVITGAEVTAVDREKKSVTVRRIADGSTFEHAYGKLVLATGAGPATAPFPVADSPKVSSFTRPADAIRFRQAAQQGEIGNVVIVGGGFIGCELAEATTSLWGMETTLIEREPQLLPYGLDPEMALIVKREMERQDVTVKLSCTVKAIELDDHGNPVVRIEGCDDLTVDYVFLCVGVNPRADLAVACGIETGFSGGISVNSHMQTSDENIYAGGDCVESVHQITGRPLYLPLGSIANRHGRVIGENLAGNETEFPGVLGAFLVKTFDLNSGSVGLSEQAARDAGIEARSVWGSFPDKPDYYPEVKTLTAKLVYETRSERLLGVQAVGTGDVCRRVDVASAFMQNKARLSDVIDFEHGYAPPYAEALDPLHHLAALAQAEERGLVFVSPGLGAVDHGHLPADIVWLDVREPEEIENLAWPCPAGKLVRIPLNDLSQRLGELEPEKKTIVVCRRGPRAYQAALILKRAGFKDVEIVGGGTQAALS
jgi:NADPH-dependent 2,4-dienoyl-CoA reductase/sulfur reductase-like enzyme/rhodanese-related sulfurtransferase